MKQSNKFGMLPSSKGFCSERRRFLKQTRAVSLFATSSISPAIIAAKRKSSLALTTNPLGFSGQRKDPVTGGYHLGHGYRMYNPRTMRFHAADSMSPFGRGGINSYAYCLGDPVNRSDPSGHFAIMTLIIGAVIGAVVGAAVSAAAEGIRAAVTGTKFDAKQVGIGAALGLISGGFGAAAVGARMGVQVGLAVADSVVSGAADFGIGYGVNKGMGMSNADAAKSAGISAGIGAVIGLATFGVGELSASRVSMKSFHIKQIENADFKYITLDNNFGKPINGPMNLKRRGDYKRWVTNSKDMIVYRQDNRSLNEIIEAGGFHPRNFELNSIPEHMLHTNNYSYISTSNTRLRPNSYGKYEYAIHINKGGAIDTYEALVSMNGARLPSPPRIKEFAIPAPVSLSQIVGYRAW